MAELGLQKAYQKALPIYQEALKAGVADKAMLEAKIATMEETLGRASTPPKAEEAETPPKTEAVTEKPATPATPEGKTGKTVVAPPEETKPGETGGSAEPAAEVGKGTKEEKDTGVSSEPPKNKGEETPEKPEAFRDWLKAKRSQL